MGYEFRRSAATRKRCSAWLCVLLWGIAATALVTASAAGQQPQEGELRLYDVRHEIREHFGLRLPYGWYIEEPSRLLLGYEIRLQIPIW